ncbi:MAG: hypothetical protein ACWGN7_02135 [Thermodesulfovibrionales bacterium]
MSRIFSILFLALLVSCGNESVRHETRLPVIADATVEAKIGRLMRAPVVEASGTINVKGGSLNRGGTFSVVIRGEDMSLEVYSGGVRVAQVESVGGSVRMTPRLRDEYLEHMFAVILRDSIMWWDIERYETVTYERHVLLRNSWRKLYVDRERLLPERQVFRLTGMKTVEVIYSGDRQFSAGVLPSGILFVFDAYECALDIETVSLTGDVTEHAVRDPSPQS